CICSVTRRDSSCNSRTVSFTSSVERADCSASLRTSSATTAKPFPCSPALAASILALSASKFVYDEISVMVSMTPPIALTSLQVHQLQKTLLVNFLPSYERILLIVAFFVYYEHSFHSSELRYSPFHQLV